MMAEKAADGAAWIRSFQPAPSAGIRLVCFPHIGGSANFYRGVSAVLAPQAKVYAVQYPGRQDRYHEAPMQDIHALADGVFGALGPMLANPVALFGHSMGSLVAFEVARRMERTPGGGPVALVVSGMWAPSSQFDGELPVGHLDDAEVAVERLKELSGTDPHLLEDEEMMRRMLPAIRDDYIATASYRCGPEVRLACPITAFVGDRDPYVSLAAAQAWSGHTTGGFDLQVFGGDHFYLASLQTAIGRGLSEVLRASL